MSPSENQMYPTGKHGRRFPSQHLKKFRQNITFWTFQNAINVKSARMLCKRWLEEGKFIHVDATFGFPNEKLFTKKNTVKVLDTSNRIKALHDALSTDILLIDDRYFWSMSAIKIVVPDQMGPSVWVWIEAVECPVMVSDKTQCGERRPTDGLLA